MRLLIIALLLLSGGLIAAQSYSAWKFYSEAYDNQANGMVVDPVTETAYISIGRICEEPTPRECAELLAIDSSGNQLYRERYLDVDIASHTILNRGKELLLFGNKSVQGNDWVVQSIEPQSGVGHDILKIYDGSAYSDIFIRMTAHIGQYYYVLGDIRWQRKDIGLLVVCDTALTTIRSIHLDTVDQGDFADLYAINDTTIAVLYDEEGDFDIGKRYKWVAHYDSRTFERVWEYRHAEAVDSAPSKGLALTDGDFLFDVGAKARGSRFVRMNRDSVIKWDRNFFRGGGTRFTSLSTREIIGTQDGHILIAGTCTDLYDLDYIPENCACLIKLNNQTGRVIWQRILYQERSSTLRPATPGLMTDVVEMPDGDLVAVARLWESAQQAVVLLRMDSEGCITPDCGKYIDLDELAVSSEEVEWDGGRGEVVRVYPNPSTGDVTIGFNDTETSGTIEIITLTGQIAHSQRFTRQESLNVTINSSGVYIIKILYNDGRSESYKHIVTR